MNRRSFLKCLLGVVGLPAAASMGMDAVSALRPVKEPEYFDNLVDLKGNRIPVASTISHEDIERARVMLDSKDLPADYDPVIHPGRMGRYEGFSFHTSYPLTDEHGVN